MAENTIEILILAHDLASDAMKAINTEAKSLGGSLVDLGSKLTLATAGVAAVLANATGKAVTFDETMTNIAATIGATADQQKALTADLLDFGKDTRYGPQQISEAYLDVASGVGLVSARMATLEASTRLAEAGNADLAGTTKGMISIMNSYGFEAEQAGYATDVMSKVVQVGVGSMDDFAAALPGVTGLAASLGVEFGELGAATALLTAKGATASVATTQLRAVMTSLLNPNEKLKAVLKEMGYETGQAAIKELGLHGAMMAVSEAAGDDLMGALGSAEAMMGIVSLSGEAAAKGMQDFQKGIGGATDAARDIQMTSAAAQMDLFNSSMEAIQLQIGSAFLPAMNQIVGAVKPVLDGIFDWIQSNPELTSTILMVTSAVVAAGPIIAGIGAVIGLIFSPVTLVVGAIAALAVAFKTNFMGIGDLLRGVGGWFINVFTTIVDSVQHAVSFFGDGGIGAVIKGFFTIFEDGSSYLGNIFESLGFAKDQASAFAVSVHNAFNGLVDFVTTVAIPGLQALASWFTDVLLPAAGSVLQNVVIPLVQQLFDFLAAAWARVEPALTMLSNWFTYSLLPLVSGVITESVIPAIEAFGRTLGDIWAVVSPALISLMDWFTVSAMPAIMVFITDTVIPGVNTLIQAITRVWTDVSPFLVSLFDWFVNSALPVVVSFINDVAVPVIQYLTTTIGNIWNFVSPILGKLYEWFVVIGLPIIRDELTKASNFVQGFIDIISGIWNWVSPKLLDLQTGIGNIMKWIGDNVIQPAITTVDNLIKIFSTIWDAIRPGVEVFRDSIKAILDGISDAIWDVLELLGIAQRQQELVAAPSIRIYTEDEKKQMAANGGTLPGAQGAAQQNYTLPASFFNTADEKQQFIASGGIVDESRDSGGPGVAGTPYMIGKGAQPEVFVPSTNGTFIPNIDKILGQDGGSGGDTYEVMVTVTEREVLSAATAEENGGILGRKISEEINRRG